MALPALIGLGLGAFGAYQGAKQQKRASDLEGRGLQMTEQQYAERSPFRDRARAGAAAEQVPIQSGGLFRDTGNPYSANYADLHGRDMGADLMAQGRTAAGPASAPDPMQGVDPRLLESLRRLPIGNGAQAADRLPGRMPQAAPPQDRSGLEMQQLMAMLQQSQGLRR